MMRTATDIYTGQSGMYIIKGEDEKAFSSLVKYKYDIPLILQDKSFTESLLIQNLVRVRLRKLKGSLNFLEILLLLTERFGLT